MPNENWIIDARQTLLKDSEYDESCDEAENEALQREQKLRRQYQKSYSMLKNGIWMLSTLNLLLGLLVIWLIAVSRSATECVHPDLLPSPAREANAIQYETRYLKGLIRGNPFAGDPSPTLDKAWHDLTENNNIRVSKQELERVNLTSIELADRSGFVAQLGFYHDLHCLKVIRHWIYKEHYHQNDTEAQARESKAHVDHCIESLREAVLCHADTSLTTFRWVGGGHQHITAENVGLHQCVNWERLRSWINSKAVHLSHPGTLNRSSPDAEASSMDGG